MSETINGAWISNDSGQKIAPKTFTGQVLSNDGTNNLDTILSGKAESSQIPTKVSQLSNDSGYTTNTGTVTGIKMNGSSKGTSGVVDLGTVLTSLPTASSSTLGGVKVDGSSITISDGVISATEGVKVYSGTGDPSSSLGKNGDIYIKLV